MQITVNGENKALDSALTIENFLKQLNVDPRKVAVERNLEIVPKSKFDSVLIDDGDRLEIVHFIGGG